MLCGLFQKPKRKPLREYFVDEEEELESEYNFFTFVQISLFLLLQDTECTGYLGSCMYNKKASDNIISLSKVRLSVLLSTQITYELQTRCYTNRPIEKKSS